MLSSNLCFLLSLLPDLVICNIGKYYPVDAGYPNTKGYLGPYKNCKYHLQDHRGSRNRPRGAQKIFNHEFSSLRNVIERCFGILKARFPILKQMAPYSLNSQMLIVVACITLHNFIRQEGQRDWLFQQYNNEDLIVIHSDNEDDDDI